MKKIVFFLAFAALTVSAHAEGTPVTNNVSETKTSSVVQEVHDISRDKMIKIGVDDFHDSLAWTAASVNIGYACDYWRLTGQDDPKGVSMSDAEQDIDKITSYALNQNKSKLLKSIMEDLARTENDRREKCRYSKIKASFETAKMLKK